MKKLLITSLSLVSLIASNNGFCAGSDPTDDRTPAPTRVSPSSSNAGLHALAAAAAAAPQPLGVTSSSSSSSSSVAVAARDQRRRSDPHLIPTIVVPTLQPFGSRPTVGQYTDSSATAAAAAVAVAAAQIITPSRSFLAAESVGDDQHRRQSLHDLAAAADAQTITPGRSALSIFAAPRSLHPFGSRPTVHPAAGRIHTDPFAAAAARDQRRRFDPSALAAEGVGDDQRHTSNKRPRSDDGDSDSGNTSASKAGKRPRRGSAAVASSGETSSSSSSSAAASSPSDDDDSHPTGLIFKKQRQGVKLFYGEEPLVYIHSRSRNDVSKSFRSLLNRLSDCRRPKKEREEIVKMFMERFGNVDFRLVFFKPFGEQETPLVTILLFMEAVRRGDADLKSVLTEAPASPFGRLSTSIDAIKKDRHQMFAIAYQAVALLEGENAMSKEAYREQIEAPFKRIFGQSPDEIIDTKEESAVLSPADVLAVWKAQQVSIDTTLRGFSSYLDFFKKVIADRSAAGQAGAGNAVYAGVRQLLQHRSDIGETSSSSSSSAASAAAAGPSPSDDDDSHPTGLIFKKQRKGVKLFYGEEPLVYIQSRSRNDVSKSFRSLLNCLSSDCRRPKKEREEIIKMFMERFEKVDLRLVFSKPFGGHETPLEKVFAFMEAVRRGDAGLKSALTEKSESLFDDLSTSIDAIKKDPHQMFAIAYQAVALLEGENAMSKEAYREQIEAPFKRIFGQSPDEVIGTKEEPLVLSPADFLAIFNAQKNSVETKLHVFDLRLRIFDRVIAARTAAGQDGAAAASSGGTSSSSSSSAADSAALRSLLLDRGSPVHPAAGQAGAGNAVYAAVRQLLQHRSDIGETSSSSSSSAASAAAAGSSASDDDTSHPSVLTFKKERYGVKIFYGEECLVRICSRSRNHASTAFRSLLNRLSVHCMQEKEREEIIKMFMERFEKVDLRLVFSKPFGGHETPLEKVFAFMEAVRRGDAGLKSALTEAPASPFGRLSTSIDAIKKDRHQMFAIAYQAVALLEGENAMSKEAYREQIEAPFKRIFGQSPDEIIDTKEESAVLSPADVLAVWKAQQVSIDTTLRGFSSYLDFFKKVIADRSAAGQAGAAAVAAASSGGTSSSSSSSSASSADPAAADAASSGP